MKSQLVPFGSVKFRENSADSVTFHLGGHTASMPQTVTLSRTLPTPRKGNAGTVKIYANYRRSMLINSGTVNEKIVPLITKIETSVPVGITENDAVGAIVGAMENYIYTNTVGDVIRWPDGRDNSIINMLVKGILPDGRGDPAQ